MVSPLLTAALLACAPAYGVAVRLVPITSQVNSPRPVAASGLSYSITELAARPVLTAPFLLEFPSVQPVPELAVRPVLELAASTPLELAAASPVVAPAENPPSPEQLQARSSDLFDGTAQLKAHHQDIQDSKAGPLPAQAQDHAYLFVPGFAWDALPDYFGPNLKRLKSLGLTARLVETHPLATSKENAQAIRDAIARAKKPVVIIAHSKGGLDVLEALKDFPELQAKVRALVALQTPYLGTAVADWFLARPWVFATAMAYARLVNPVRMFSANPFFRMETAKELSRERRGALEGVAPAVTTRIYSVASRIKDDTNVKLLMWITAGTIKALTGRHSDGVIVPEEALIPGSRYALLDHVAHIDTVSDPSSWRHKLLGVRGHDPRFAADLTEAIVRWVFS